MSFKFKTLSKVNFNDPILIEGLPGIGNVGKIAVDFLVDSLNAKSFLEIYSDHFPNSVFVNENNLVDLPKMTFYHKKKGNKDFIFLTGDIQPVDEFGCYQLCYEVVRLMKRSKCKLIITLGGIGMNKIPENPQVYITGNSKKALAYFKEKSINKKIFGTVGPVMGVTGLLVGLSGQQNINSVCLLSQTFGHPNYLGIKGAKELIRVLDGKYGFKLNFKDLNKEIKEIESELSLKLEEQTNFSSKEGADQISYIG